MASRPLLFAIALLAGGGCADEAAPVTPGSLVVILAPGQIDPAAEELGEPRPNFHDFGHVTTGEETEFTFKLWNPGDEPVAIVDMKAACGCTVPSVSYTDEDGMVVRGLSNRSGADELLVVPPGMEVDLRVAVDTDHVRIKNTDRLLTITITTDSEETRYVRLEVHIFVEAAFLVTPNGIDMGRVPMGSGGSGACEIIRAPGFEKDIVAVAEVSEGFSAEIEKINRFGTTVWILTGRLDAPAERGRHEGKIVLETVDETGDTFDPLEIGITAMAVDDLVIDPGRLFAIAESDSPGATGVVKLSSLLPGHRYRVTGVEPQDAHADMIAITWEPDSPDTEGKSQDWTLTLEVKGELPKGITSGRAVLTTNDPQNPTLQVPYVVHAR